MEAVRLKRVVIKEELFSLTNDTFEAIILGQLIYWQERVEDFDVFITEESERMNNNGELLNMDKQNGWIYKSSKELIEECMLTISIATMRRYLQKLIDKGFIESRINEKYKWDKKLQYRVKLGYVISEIKRLGYDGLSGYKLCNFETSNFQNEKCKSEITNINNLKEKENSKKENENDFIDEIYKLYPSKCPVRNISTGKCSKNKEQIKRLLKTYSKEQIRAVVKYEIETKKGKTMLKNFGTFLNNFPDPNELSIVPTNGEYKPSEDSGDIFYNKSLKCYGTVSDPTHFVRDGYTRENRPKGAKLSYQMFMCVWNYDTKSWNKINLNEYLNNEVQ